MSNLSITQNQSESPFNSIRRFDEQGSEFWYARELMPLLEYKRWDRVPDVIDRATISCQNSGNLVSEHFSEETRKTSGRPQQDWKLSRYACYLVAMNGDPRKEAIAQAQTYFAVKTREAEIVIPQQSEEIERMRLELELIKAKKGFMEYRDSIRQLHGESMLALLDGRPDAVVEKIEKVTETIVVRDGRNVSFEGQSTKQMATSLGFKTGAELERWLEKIGRSDLICQGLRVNQASYIPTENISEVKRVWANNRTKGRQLIIGE